MNFVIQKLSNHVLRLTRFTEQIFFSGNHQHGVGTVLRLLASFLHRVPAHKGNICVLITNQFRPDIPEQLINRLPTSLLLAAKALTILAVILIQAYYGLLLTVEYWLRYT